MFRWCSYCQTFLGEKPPHDQYGFTHGICDNCKTKDIFDSSLAQEAAPIADFYRRLLHAGLLAQPPEATTVLEEGLRMGLRPLDLLIGIVQPLQYEIGQAWERGEITFQTEHAHTAQVTRLVEAIATSLAGPNIRQSKTPDILLVTPPGEIHRVGLQMVEAYLLMSGVACHVAPPNSSAQEIITLVGQLKPARVGISVTLPQNLSAAYRLIQEIHEATTPSPEFLLGGFAVRDAVEGGPSERVVLCRQLMDLRLK